MLSVRRLTFLTSLGAALEYYDFVIYMVFLDYISQIFFPKNNAIMVTLETISVFAMGYLVRPIGGIIFGIIGDRFGRKKTFISSILLMATATLCIGCLPSYEQAGLMSTFLLILCRLLQGLSYGAELPSAITYISEHSYLAKRGMHNGLLFFSISIGAALSTFFGYCITHYFSETTIVNWAWRLPFIVGGLLAFVGYYLRKHALESPLFQEKQKSSQPLSVLLKYHRQKLITGIIIALCPASLIVFSLYLPYYLSQHFDYAQSDVFGILTIVLLIASITLPFFGWLSDSLGRKRLLFYILGVVIVGIYPLFTLLKLDHSFAFFTFMLLYQIFITSLTTCYPLIAELFPTSVRTLGVALSYNLSFSIAAFIPLLHNILWQWTHQEFYITFIFILVAMATLQAIRTIQDKTREVLQ